MAEVTTAQGAETKGCSIRKEPIFAKEKMLLHLNVIPTMFFLKKKLCFHRILERSQRVANFS